MLFLFLFLLGFGIGWGFVWAAGLVRVVGFVGIDDVGDVITARWLLVGAGGGSGYYDGLWLFLWGLRFDGLECGV